MTKYQNQKRKIRTLVNEFDLFDDLFKLAEANIKIVALLEENKFPIKEYQVWLEQTGK